ncbi:MAG: hypothetical protein Q8Q08_13025 [Candidatus Omnitrophota bacterium]|nr:hypothetical protein [Candidatus Omnitrophota bacterium]
MASKPFSDPPTRAHAYENLRDFAEVLPDHWWLEAGTCLGFFREGDFIGHDLDLDFGILAEDFSWDIVNELVRRGFGIHRVYGARDHGLEIRMARHGIKCDIFLFYRNGEELWHAAWRNGGADFKRDIIYLVFERALLMDRAALEIEAPVGPPIHAFVPERTEDYLRARYGKHWAEPNPNWRWDLDPRCIVPKYRPAQK